MKDTGTMADVEDGQLIARCRQGDLDAFEELVRKYQKKMFNIAYRITGDHDDAAEAVQDAFFSAHRSLTGFEQRSQFSTWIYSITVNMARNRMRQTLTRRRRETGSIDDPPHPEGPAGPEPASGDPSALDLLLQKDRQWRIQQCLNALEQDFREVIVLRDIQGFSYEEIAAMLTLAAGTVKSRLFRAREMVRNCLKQSGGEW